MNKIKFLIASSFYPEYLKYFHAANPGIENKSYQNQYHVLMDDCFSWADFWKINLEKIGSYEAQQIVTNAEIMQKKWAQENNISFNQSDWLLEILEAQIASFKPDIFFAQDFKNITPEFRKIIKKKYPHIKLIIGWDGIAKNDPITFRGIDLIMSCGEYVTNFYKNNDFKTYYFPNGFEATILNKINKKLPTYDLSFIGSLVIKKNAHNKRLKMLANLSRQININIWISSLAKYTILSKKFLKYLYQQNLSEFYNIRQINKYNQGSVFGLKMYQTLADSKISLNIHIDSSNNTAGNLRLFETTGIGSCLVTDWKNNLGEIFELNKEIVTYKSLPECIDKIKYLLNNEGERKKIALAGQKRTLTEHTYEKRISEFSDHLMNIL